MRKSKVNEHGSAMLMVMLMMIPLLAMIGFVIDLGWYYFTVESAHAAAESAALAGAQYAMDDVAGGGTYTCGSNNLTCQAETACPATLPNPITSNLTNGCAYASANGFTNGGLNGQQTVTIQAETTSPPPTVPGVSVLYWVTVRAYQTNPLTFLSVLGAQTLKIGVRVTAAVIPAVITDCVIALDPSASKAITISGGANVTASNCSVADNSSDSDALDVSGGSQLTAQTVQVAGNYNDHGCSSCISPTPQTDKTLSNPYASLPIPTFSTTCTQTNYKNTGTATISQGTYCGGITNNGNLTLSPGTYILLGGGLTSSGGSSLTGSGVLIYNTCSTSPCNGGNAGYKPLTISGGSSATLSASNSGPDPGILFFQDPTVKPSGQETISGGSTTCLTGVAYFPKSNLVYSGGSSGGSCNTIIAADTITFSGGSNVGSASGSGSGPSAPKAMLIE